MAQAEVAGRVLKCYSMFIGTKGNTPNLDTNRIPPPPERILRPDTPYLVPLSNKTKSKYPDFCPLLFALMLTSAQFIRLPQVKEITSLSKSSIYRLMEDGDFPKQVALGARSVVWVKSQVEDWCAEKVATALA